MRIWEIITAVAAVVLTAAAVVVVFFQLKKKRILHELSNKNNAMNFILSSCGIGVCVYTHLQDEMIYANQTLCDIIGTNIDELYNKGRLNFIHPDDREACEKRVLAALKRGNSATAQCRVATSDGSTVWVRLFIQRKMERKNEYFVCEVSDITQIKMASENMRYRAEHDLLTGLYNRETFFEKAHDMLMENLDERFVLIRFDISRFKVYNDLYGINAGDNFLREVARNIIDMLKGYDCKCVYGRIEADHFCICMPSASISYDDFVDDMKKRLSSISGTFKVIPNFGIYEIDDPSISVNLMADRARIALASIKNSYTIKYKIYESELRSSLINEQEMVGSMDKALDNEEFVVYFQPQYDYSTGKMSGAEALVRWDYPGHGFIPPDDFITVFEQNGFITKLDHYVWEIAAKTAGQLVKLGRDDMTVSVNVSRHDIFDPMLCDFLCGLVEKYGIKREMFHLEITESAYVSSPQLFIDMVENLQKQGFHIEMDDFGSGFSSLNTLKDVPVNTIKLDMKFLTPDSGLSKGNIILTSVVKMIKWLGLGIIAEGVELQTQAEYLSAIGCDIMQGYMYSRPIPREDFLKLAASEEKSLISKIDAFSYAENGVSGEGEPPFRLENIEYFAGALNFPMAYFTVKDGKIDSPKVNSPLADLLGISVDGMSSFSIRDGVVPEDYERCTAYFDNFLSNGIPRNMGHSEILFHWNDGRFRNPLPLRGRTYSVSASDEEGDRYVTFVDVVPEAELYKSRQEEYSLEEAYNTMAAGIILVQADAPYRLLFCNDTAAKICGYKNGEEMRDYTNTQLKKEENSAIKKRMGEIIKRISKGAPPESLIFCVYGKGNVLIPVYAVLKRVEGEADAEPIIQMVFRLRDEYSEAAIVDKRIYYAGKLSRDFSKIVELDFANARIETVTGKRSLLSEEASFLDEVSLYQVILSGKPKPLNGELIERLVKGRCSAIVDITEGNIDKIGAFIKLSKGHYLLCSTGEADRNDAVRVIEELSLDEESVEGILQLLKTGGEPLARKEEKPHDLHTQRYNALIKSMSSVVFEYNPSEDILAYSISMPGGRVKEYTLTDYTENAFNYSAIHKNTVAAFVESLKKVSRNGSKDTVELLSSFFDNKYHWSRSEHAALVDKNGNVECVVGRIIDIHEEKLRLLNQQRKLKARAAVDGMTGLLNKETLEKDIGKALNAPAAEKCILVEVDIDNFKQVNDSYGHSYGDLIIKNIASSIRSCCKRGDIAGRYGGDEFVVLFKNISPGEMADKKLKQLHERIKERLPDDKEIEFTVSIGAAQVHKGEKFAEAFDRIDMAMYKVKKLGRNNYLYLKNEKQPKEDE